MKKILKVMLISILSVMLVGGVLFTSTRKLRLLPAIKNCIYVL